ncbi:unnamed protein product [Lactuca saligna]|uniref:Uncharacterized protein n=1 Tax=Lactuca saligna TaxID=75948 RepID=A0AA35YM44_LACSI|nr:unnamed protein product [Lactuca saligna]
MLFRPTTIVAYVEMLGILICRCFRKVIGVVQIVHANIAVRTVVELEVHFLHAAFVRKKVKKIGYFPLLICSPSPLVFRHFSSFARPTVVQLHKHHKGTRFEADEEMCGDDEDREALQETIKNMQAGTKLVLRVLTPPISTLLILVCYGQPPPQQSPNAAPQGGRYAQPAPYSIL